MNAARSPRPAALERLLVVDPEVDAVLHLRATDLPRILSRGDVLVVNDAATLPASLSGSTADGEPVEVRLLSPPAAETPVVLFGAGDWRTPTERRPPPPPLRAGGRIAFSGGLEARVLRIEHGRFADVAFSLSGAELLAAIYAGARPVQYAYLDDDVRLSDVQTSYAGRPWSMEMPSAGRPLSVECLVALARRGVRVAALTHAAGLSSIGDDVADARLPLPERYEIPDETARLIADARARGGRVVAVGTTVVRALEGAARRGGGAVPAGAGSTDLVLDGRSRLRVVDAVLSGVHEPGTSHFRLLQAFAPVSLLDRSAAEAERRGYLVHEFGDACFIARGAARAIAAEGLAEGGAMRLDSGPDPQPPR